MAFVERIKFRRDQRDSPQPRVSIFAESAKRQAQRERLVEQYGLEKLKAAGLKFPASDWAAMCQHARRLRVRARKST